MIVNVVNDLSELISNQMLVEKLDDTMKLNKCVIESSKNTIKDNMNKKMN